MPILLEVVVATKEARQGCLESLHVPGNNVVDRDDCCCDNDDAATDLTILLMMKNLDLKKYQNIFFYPKIRAC